jgi:S1-C subfamily serine protease
MTGLTDQERILCELRNTPNGRLSHSQIKELLGFDDDKYNKIILLLIHDGLVRSCKKGRGGGICLTMVQEEEETTGSYGTGFFVSNSGHVLTCAHVVSGRDPSVMVSKVFSLPSPAQIVAIHVGKDLALLKTDLRPTALPVLSTNISVGEEIAVYGFPHPETLARNPNFAIGNVAAADAPTPDEELTTSMFTIDAAVYGANSGSPVLDRSGNIIRVVEGGFRHLHNVNFAINTTIVLRFLAAHGIDISTTEKAKHGVLGFLKKHGIGISTTEKADARSVKVAPNR